MLRRKGQVTLFVIVGIVLLIVIGLILYLSNSPLWKSEAEQARLTEMGAAGVRPYVEACIQSVGKDALVWIGTHGGYFEIPKHNESDYEGRAYYLYIDQDVMPSKATVEKELSRYMDEELFFCISNLEYLNETGLNIEQGNIKTASAMRADGVIFKVSLPMNISKEQDVVRLESFQGTITDVRLLTVYELSKSIMEEQMKDLGSVCLSCITDLGVKNNMSVSIERLDDSNLLFTITDYNSTINGNLYKYKFVNRYEEFSCSNLPPGAYNIFFKDCVREKMNELNYTFYVEEISDLIAYANKDFFYKIDAKGFNLTFEDYTPLFDIGKKTGEIRFTPNQSQAGNYTVWMYIKDQLGNQEYRSFGMIIENENQ